MSVAATPAPQSKLVSWFWAARPFSLSASVAPGAGARASGRAQRLAGRLHAMVLYEWPDTDAHDDFLHRMDAYCRELHELVTAAWFDYAVEDAPGS